VFSGFIAQGMPVFLYAHNLSATNLRYTIKNMKKAKNPVLEKKSFYVYILKCKDGTYYTGYTTDLKKRLSDHNRGKLAAKYTRGRRPVKLIWKIQFKTLSLALKTECAIKGLTRKKKELLVKGNDLEKILI
jgi:putative endonuclease